MSAIAMHRQAPFGDCACDVEQPTRTYTAGCASRAMCHATGAADARAARSSMVADDHAVFTAELHAVMSRRRTLGVKHVSSMASTDSRPVVSGPRSADSLRSRGQLGGNSADTARSRSPQPLYQSGSGCLGLDVRAVPDTLGVAFSGGGIRSAAFGCGALTVLAQKGVLPRVDYVSCVSGGGYAVTSLLTHLQQQQQQQQREQQHQEQQTGQSVTQVRSPQRLFQDATNALSERMTANSSYLIRRRNSGTTAANAAEHDTRRGMRAMSAVPDASVRNQWCTATACDTLGFLWTILKLFAGVPLFLVAVSVLVAVASNALAGPRLQAVLRTASMAGLMEQFQPEVYVSAAVAVTAGITMYCTRSWSYLGTVSAQAYHHVATLILALLASMWAVAGFMVVDERMSGTDGDEVVEVFAVVLVAVAGIGAAVGVFSVTGTAMNLACFAAPVSVLWMIARLTAYCVRQHGMPTPWVVAAVVLVVASVAAFESITNRLHHYYRRRLRRAFYAKGGDVALASLDTSRMPFLLCNAVMNDYARHSDEERCTSFVMSPLYCGSQRTGFCATPGHVTLSHVMAVSGAAVALAMGNADAKGRLRLLLGMLGISLGHWFPLTTAGARDGSPAATHAMSTEISTPAAREPSPNLGAGITSSAVPRGTSGGVWPKPGGSGSGGRTAAVTRPHLSMGAAGLVAVALMLSFIHTTVLLVALATGAAAVVMSLLPGSRWLLHVAVLRHLHQALGVVHIGAPPPYVYLSDGGHLDNLGIVELLKRRCAHIVAFDCGHDPSGQCGDLLTAIDMAQCQLGCSFLPVHPGQGDYVRAVKRFIADPRARHLELRVQYFETSSSDAGLTNAATQNSEGHHSGVAGSGIAVKEGTLVYVKSRLAPGDGDLLSRERRDPFPQHSTAHQFYPPTLFHRYAQLGRRAATAAMVTPALAAACGAPAKVEAAASGNGAASCFDVADDLGLTARATSDGCAEWEVIVGVAADDMC